MKTHRGDQLPEHHLPKANPACFRPLRAENAPEGSFDEETGLDYFGARYYAPWLGRWTTADPLGLQAGLNLYLYGRASPLNFVDPNGMQDKPSVLRSAEYFCPRGDDSPPEPAVVTRTKALEAEREWRPEPDAYENWNPQEELSGGEGGPASLDSGYTEPTQTIDPAGVAFAAGTAAVFLIGLGLIAGGGVALGGTGAAAGGSATGGAATGGGVLSVESQVTISNLVAGLTESIQLPQLGFATAAAGVVKGSGVADDAGRGLIGLGKAAWQSFTTGGSSAGKAAPLNEEAKTILRAEAREIWENLTGEAAAEAGLQVHHRIPLEWAHLFPNADPNRVANLVGMDPTSHGQITAMWNAWRNSLGGRTPSQAEIMGVAIALDEAFVDAMKFAK